MIGVEDDPLSSLSLWTPRGSEMALNEWKICTNQKTDDRKENLHCFGVESVLKSGATKT